MVSSSCCLVNDVACVTFSIQGARIFNSAITSVFCFIGGFSEFVDFSCGVSKIKSLSGDSIISKLAGLLGIF